MSDTPYWYFSTPKVLAEQLAQPEPVAQLECTFGYTE